MNMSISQAKFITEGYGIYLKKRTGWKFSKLAEFYRLSKQGAIYRYEKMVEYINDGSLKDRLKEANEILAAANLTTQEWIVSEKLPVRSVSGVRFSPLY